MADFFTHIRVSALAAVAALALTRLHRRHVHDRGRAAGRAPIRRLRAGWSPTLRQSPPAPSSSIRAATSSIGSRATEQAIRYGVSISPPGFVWNGLAVIHTKQRWPDWYPPADMLARKPELREHMAQLQSGLGMKGGPDNPLGARAMYLWQNDLDTLYRLHGTNDPSTIGHNVSSGCIRLTNDDITDLYNRTAVGTEVIVLATAGPPPPAATQ